MSFWNTKSISGKLTRMNLLVSGTALLLAYISFLAYDLYSLRQNLIASLNTEASIIGSNCVTALLFDDQQAAESTLAALRGSPHVLSAIILRPDGTTFAKYVADASVRPLLRVHLSAEQASGHWVNTRHIVVARRIVFADRSLGSVYLDAETSDLTHRMLQFGLISAFILLLCFVIAILITTTVRRLIIGPLTGLAETAQIVSRERDYSVRARLPRGSDELHQLVQSFNEMLEQIQQRDRDLETSRKNLEERVRERTAELTNANNELEAFSYSVAHDLRGPLQHISNITFLLQQITSNHGNSDAASLIEKLFEGNRRMSTLIDDLLNLSKATSTPLHRRAFNMSEMVTTILDSLQAESSDRRVEIKVAPGAHVIADEGLISVVLENLLRNAWKYSARSKPSKIEFGVRPGTFETVYFVRDNGVGFNPSYADRLFRPFHRLHSQSEFPGTGVGLATVYRIITRHGGKIWATGSVDHGAEFSFTVPYNSSEERVA